MPRARPARESVHDEVEQWLDAESDAGRPCQHGHQRMTAHRLRKSACEIFVGERALVEVLLGERVVRAGHGFHQRLARLLGLCGQLGRDPAGRSPALSRKRMAFIESRSTSPVKAASWPMGIWMTATMFENVARMSRGCARVWRARDSA